jgi:hypothetical protein
MEISNLGNDVCKIAKEHAEELCMEPRRIIISPISNISKLTFLVG